MKTKLMLGDNIISLKKLPDNSVDSVVTDSPYGLSAARNSGKTSTGGFMNKKWDYEVPSVEFWKEVYRVLKPGGHILSFGGTRTYHRMVINIEDAGFEIRDQIMWIYGSGFPKSMNIGKAYDKMMGNEREFVGIHPSKNNHTSQSLNTRTTNNDYTKGTSPYEGLGTGLKPANEPICLARKPLSEKTIVDNVIKWGTGGINIDESRIQFKDEKDFKSAIFGTQPKITSKGVNNEGGTFQGYKQGVNNTNVEPSSEGRFPANILFDETAAQMLDEQTGILESGKMLSGQKVKGYDGPCMGKFKPSETKSDTYGDKGGASRFFYVAKVSKKERNMGLDGFEDKVSQLNSGGIGRKVSVEKRLENNGENAPTMKNTHPTLKPINLMTYLIKLVTPKDGIILDPFMGSGSTGIAAQLEGHKFIGMEMDEDYFKIAEQRIKEFEQYRTLLKK